MKQKLSEKILNHLKYGKTADGQVGCKVNPIEENDKNKAWLSIRMKKGYDSRFDPAREYFICYEIEYIELDENYDEEKNGMDYDLFLVRKDSYYNIRDVEQLERALNKWINDFSIIKPILDVCHPIY